MTKTKNEVETWYEIQYSAKGADDWFSANDLVPFKWSGAYDDNKGKAKAAAMAAKPFLVDGWSEFRADDFFNHHCWGRNEAGEFQRVVFWRYVDKAEETLSDALSAS